MSQSGETSAEVQREAETERAELADTLGRLRENLKPANVVDEVMATAKVTTSEMTDWAWATARNNPIPATLIGLGAIMLVGVGQTARSRLAARSRDAEDADDVSGTSTASVRVGGSGSSGSNSGLGAGWRAANASASAAARRIDNSVRDLRAQTQGLADRTSSAKARTPGDKTMAQYGRSSRDGLTQTVTRLFDEQPLILAALGVAVGAAIGAAIPGTDAESRLMGDASAQVRSRAQEIAAAEYAHLKETASSTVDDLKRTAADHGVSTENLSGLINDAGSRVKDAANDVTSHAAGSTGLQT